MRPDPDCRLCPLYKGRTNMVMPSGDMTSKVAFVGEAPGENEDLTGRPFIGRSGMLLERMLLAEEISRDEVMITNTVKCRPPGNRAPTEEEMKACRPFLESELEGKELVICLGASACRSLLGYEGRMGDIVNTEQTITMNGRCITVIPAYHPAACIYSRMFAGSLRDTVGTVGERMRK